MFGGEKKEREEILLYTPIMGNNFLHLVLQTPSLPQVDGKSKINWVNCTTMCDARRVWAVSVQRYLGPKAVVNLSRHTTKKMLFKDN